MISDKVHRLSLFLICLLLQVSDDEDDTHPNIDTPSLFRWRHQARLERDAAWRKEKEEFETNYKTFLTQYNTCKQDLDKAKQSNNSDTVQELQKKLDELESQAKEWSIKEADLKKRERVCSSSFFSIVRS